VGFTISDLLLTTLMMLVAYLSGSISSAILICKLFNLPDPREEGSHNPGATNVLRLGNKLAAALVLIFDVLKGTIPVWAAFFLGINPIYLGIIGVSACLGHMYPIFFGFKGGKAVATAFGVLLPLGFSFGALLIATWFSVAKITRYSSLAAICTFLLAPLYSWWLKPLYVLPVTMLSILIILRHRENIYRLLKGTESKISSNKSKK
jgi:glycerol-3-phosphate acyltransferase PlsY